LDNTIHHELLHMLIESYARPGTPQWFREGLVLYLSNPNAAAGSGNADLPALETSLRAPQSEEELRRAYAEARARVAQLAQQHGKDTLLAWVQNGLPPDLAARGNVSHAGGR
jgi:stage II sporulation protein D